MRRVIEQKTPHKNTLTDDKIKSILEEVLHKPPEPAETLRQYDKRELNKIIRNTVKSSEIVASSILSISDIHKAQEIAKGYDIPIVTPEEQLTSIGYAIEEYVRKYKSIEGLREVLKENPDYYLESILTEWEFYQEVLKKEE
ncbi:MAG TPA: hypothetical protein ENL40_01065 [Thermococcus litoralis]|uniref:Uncharacterized protein n=1 Tax=Thermococcus litoralis TaxID=2265 RepID=A0A7C5JYE2_THELI|nr:hypothetical protein [Thermococcus litoralis]